MSKDYSKHYSANKLKAKLLEIAGKFTQKILRQILTLVALLKSDDVPVYAKAGIVAVLGYLIFPCAIGMKMRICAGLCGNLALRGI